MNIVTSSCIPNWEEVCFEKLLQTLEQCLSIRKVVAFCKCAY